MVEMEVEPAQDRAAFVTPVMTLAELDLEHWEGKQHAESSSEGRQQGGLYLPAQPTSAAEADQPTPEGEQQQQQQQQQLPELDPSTCPSSSAIYRHHLQLIDAQRNLQHNLTQLCSQVHQVTQENISLHAKLLRLRGDIKHLNAQHQAALRQLHAMQEVNEDSEARLQAQAKFIRSMSASRPPRITPIFSNHHQQDPMQHSGGKGSGSVSGASGHSMEQASRYKLPRHHEGAPYPALPPSRLHAVDRAGARSTGELPSPPGPRRLELQELQELQERHLLTQALRGANMGAERGAAAGSAPGRSGEQRERSPVLQPNKGRATPPAAGSKRPAEAAGDAMPPLRMHASAAEAGDGGPMHRQQSTARAPAVRPAVEGVQLPSSSTHKDGLTRDVQQRRWTPQDLPALEQQPRQLDRHPREQQPQAQQQQPQLQQQQQQQRGIEDGLRGREREQPQPPERTDGHSSKPLVHVPSVTGLALFGAAIEQLECEEQQGAAPGCLAQQGSGGEPSRHSEVSTGSLGLPPAALLEPRAGRHCGTQPGGAAAAGVVTMHGQPADSASMARK